MLEAKHHLINTVLNELRESYATLKKAAAESNANSSSEESKAEGKYDTRGLEASYLAEGQREFLHKFEDGLNRLEALESEDEPSSALLGSLIVMGHDEGEENYLILPAGAGIEIEHEGEHFVIITSSSPIGSELLGKEIGDSIEHSQFNGCYISEIY
ncbi:hypothetical protein OAB00_01830 [Akkermansiaceae bacterium]|nr:hypothetical protein [Akkermansiaceae bacterium]